MEASTQAQEQISIQEVLSLIRSSTDASQPFLIRAIKSTGRPGVRGTIRTYGQCIKGTPKGEVQGKSEEEKSGRKFLHKERDTLPLLDLEAGGMIRNIPISHIIGYNQYKVIH